MIQTSVIEYEWWMVLSEWWVYNVNNCGVNDPLPMASKRLIDKIVIHTATYTLTYIHMALIWSYQITDVSWYLYLDRELSMETSQSDLDRELSMETSQSDWTNQLIQIGILLIYWSQIAYLQMNHISITNTPTGDYIAITNTPTGDYIAITNTPFLSVEW